MTEDTTKPKAPTYGFLYILARVVMELHFRLRGGRVLGLERVPDNKTLIVAANHVTSLDPPWIHSLLRGKISKLASMAKQELWDIKLKLGSWTIPVGRLMSNLGCFPVNRENPGPQMYRGCLARLEEGTSLLIFPEGTRGDGESLGEFHTGAARLSIKTDKPILPVGIVYRRDGSGVNGPRVLVRFGEPFSRQPGQSVDDFNKHLREQIEALI